VNQPLHKQLKVAIEKCLNRTQIPGVAVAVRIDGEAFFETVVGYQDLNHDIPLPIDANFTNSI
jgi:D-alanyl-D-alanine carboxypeptidase